MVFGFEETRILTIDDDGQASYGKEIEGFKQSIESVHQLSNRQFMVVGQDGEIRILTIDDNGQASYGKNIEGIENDVRVVHQLSDRQILVASYNEETRILNLNRPEPSLDHLKQNLDKLVA